MEIKTQDNNTIASISGIEKLKEDAKTGLIKDYIFSVKNDYKYYPKFVTVYGINNKTAYIKSLFEDLSTSFDLKDPRFIQYILTTYKIKENYYYDAVALHLKSEGYEKIAKGIMGTYNKIKQNVDGYLSSITPVVQSSMPIVEPVVQSSMPIVEPVVQIAMPIVEPVVQSAMPIVEPVVQSAMPIVEPVVQSAMPIVEPVVQSAMPIVEPVVQSAMPIVEPVVQSAMPIVEPVVQSAMPIVEPVVQSAMPIVEPVVQSAMPIVEPVVQDSWLDNIFGDSEPTLEVEPSANEKYAEMINRYSFILSIPIETISVANVFTNIDTGSDKLLALVLNKTVKIKNTTDTYDINAINNFVYSAGSKTILKRVQKDYIKFLYKDNTNQYIEGEIKNKGVIVCKVSYKSPILKKDLQNHFSKILDENYNIIKNIFTNTGLNFISKNEIKVSTVDYLLIYFNTQLPEKVLEQVFIEGRYNTATKTIYSFYITVAENSLNIRYTKTKNNSNFTCIRVPLENIEELSTKLLYPFDRYETIELKQVTSANTGKKTVIKTIKSIIPDYDSRSCQKQRQPTFLSFDSDMTSYKDLVKNIYTDSNGVKYYYVCDSYPEYKYPGLNKRGFPCCFKKPVENTDILPQSTAVNNDSFTNVNKYLSSNPVKKESKILSQFKKEGITNLNLAQTFSIEKGYYTLILKNTKIENIGEALEFIGVGENINIIDISYDAKEVSINCVNSKIIKPTYQYVILLKYDNNYRLLARIRAQLDYKFDFSEDIGVLLKLYNKYCLKLQPIDSIIYNIEFMKTMVNDINKKILIPGKDGKIEYIFSEKYDVLMPIIPSIYDGSNIDKDINKYLREMEHTEKKLNEISNSNNAIFKYMKFLVYDQSIDSIITISGLKVPVKPRSLTNLDEETKIKISQLKIEKISKIKTFVKEYYKSYGLGMDILLTYVANSDFNSLLQEILTLIEQQKNNLPSLLINETESIISDIVWDIMDNGKLFFDYEGNTNDNSYDNNFMNEDLNFF